MLLHPLCTAREFSDASDIVSKPLEGAYKRRTMTNIDNKIEQVRERLRGLGEVVVAFSGGKDSFFLLKLALEVLGKERVTAFNVRSLFSARNDERRVRYFVNLLDFKMERIEIDIAGEPKVMANPKDRCYFCKTKIFSTLKERALGLGISSVLDGTTYSDLDEYRPGLKAIEELGIVSPLEEAKITSGEIVSYLRERVNVEEYYLTSSACMATRFPYDFQLDETALRVFDAVESFFVECGVYPVKVRYIPDGIRVETPGENFGWIFENRDKILEFCKARGLKFVTLDIEGIKSGVWD